MLVACCFGALPAHAADEPADPISRLGQRSALQRWKDARQEWMGSAFSRRERRQQRQGSRPDGDFGPDAAAPDVSLPASSAPFVADEIPELTPFTPVVTEPDAPQFIAPPRLDEPAEVSLDLTLPDPEVITRAPVDPAEPAPFPVEVVTPAPGDAGVAPSAPAISSLEEPVADPQMVQPQPVTEVAAAPATSETALLPQIPKTPLQPSPTPGPPPARLSPAPPPRLPDDSPRYDSPRLEPLIPPAPGAAPIPRLAGPAELPQLRKITDIQPFRSCSTGEGGVRLCPPGSAGEGLAQCPEQRPLPAFDGTERNFIDIEYCWEAPNLFHTPLYFEDVGLERYGHTYCEPFQSIASATKFGVQFVGLPYQMALAPIHKREYPLGYYRPGDPAPYKCYQIPLNAEAAFKAAYVYTGMSFIVP